MRVGCGGWVEGWVGWACPVLADTMDRGPCPLERVSIMETVSGKRKTKPRRARREFPPEFKAEIVALCRRGDRTIAQVVAEFDLVDSAVRRWIAQAEAEENPTGASERLTVEEKAELAVLRRENQQLKQDVAILKRAMAFFAKETR